MRNIELLMKRCVECSQWRWSRKGWSRTSATDAATQEKRSIKERLEINKRIIEKQQGKDDRGKGVDRADKMVKR